MSERVSLDNDFQEEAIKLINDQVSLYMPMILIDKIGFEVIRKDKESNNMLTEIIVSILFSIPQARIGNQMLKIKLHCMG